MHGKKFALVLSDVLDLTEKRRRAASSTKDVFLFPQHVMEIPFYRTLFRDYNYQFLDKDCAVFYWSSDLHSRAFGFRTFSLHPPQGGGSVELRQIAEFEVKDAVIIQYSRGLLAAGSEEGEIT